MLELRTTLTTFSSGQTRLMEFHSAMELTMIINVPTPERQPGRSSEILLILLIRLRLPANSASVMKSFITDSFCWLVLSMHEVPDEDLLLVYGVYVSFIPFLFEFIHQFMGYKHDICLRCLWFISLVTKHQ